MLHMLRALRPPGTHIIRLFVQVRSVFAGVDLWENLRHQPSVRTRRLAVAIPVPPSLSTAGPGASRDGAHGTPAPPPSVWVERRVTRGLSPCPEELWELQGKRPPVPPPGEVSGQQRRRGQVMLGQRMMGEGGMGEEGLLFCRIGVRVGGAAAAHAQTSSDQRSPPEAVTPSPQAVRAGPAGGRQRAFEYGRTTGSMNKEFISRRGAPSLS